MKDHGATDCLERARSDARFASKEHGGCFCIHQGTRERAGVGTVETYKWHRTKGNFCEGPLVTVFVDGNESGLTPCVRRQGAVVSCVGKMPSKRIPGQRSGCQSF